MRLMRNLIPKQQLSSGPSSGTDVRAWASCDTIGRMPRRSEVQSALLEATKERQDGLHTVSVYFVGIVMVSMWHMAPFWWFA